MEAKKKINWGPALFLIVYQAFFLITVPFYLYFYTPSLLLIFTGILLFFIGGLSITAGYHRCFSHRCYKTNPIIEAILLFFGSSTMQGSCLRWSFDHRLHHAHVDTDNDPYSINKGFWYAHCLWLLDKPKTIEPKLVSDLMNNKLVMWQHKYDKLAMFGSNVLIWFAVGTIFNDYIGALFITCLARLFFLHHCTWFINSLAHTWGDKPFSKEHTAVNNYIISLLTFGEGYHNYHHTYANDYRNGVYWYQYDPTKWLIWSLSKLGLAYNLRSIDHYTIKKKMIMEGRTHLLTRIKTLWYVKKEEIERKVLDISDQIVEKISKFNELKAKYKALKKDPTSTESKKEIKHQLKLMKKSIKADWKVWVKLNRYISHLKPIRI